MTATTAWRPRVPDLPSGVTHLTGGDPRTALRAVAVHELSSTRPTSPAYWVDVGGVAAPHALYEQGLDREGERTLQIARAFTAYQHVTLVERLAERVTAETPLVVCSNVAQLYGDDDLRRGEGRELLGASMTRLDALAADHDVPLVVTTGRVEDRRLAGLVAAVVDHTYRTRRTSHGVRFSGDEFETRAYDAPWGGRQTTMEYWRSVAAEHRAEASTDADERWVERPLEPMGPYNPTYG